MHLLTALALLPVVLADSCKVLEIGKTVYHARLDGNVCIYSNVRFATPPVGDLRFAAPQSPKDDDPEPPSQPVSCVAMNSNQGCLGLIGAPACDLSEYATGIQQEDCLFLDIYVPAGVTAEKMPVVTWIYGGGYIFGSKQGFDLTKIPLYYGKGPLSKAPEPMIFVAINYRLGAYGWLAGSYMEKNGLPNAGLADQREAINYVAQNIDKLGGDPESITLWGESAGASSILHHLVSTEDVPFHRALLMSPAYQWLWDREGVLNDTYTSFAQMLGCADGDIACVRSKDGKALKDANQKLWQTAACHGVFPVGPAVDGTVIKSLPPLMLKNGQGKKLDSLIVSHVGQEVGPKSPFVPSPVRENPEDPSKMTDFLNIFMHGAKYDDLRSQVEARYPSKDFKNQAARAAKIITDSTFVCNTRQLVDAYSSSSSSSSVYAMEYDFLDIWDFATHGTDLFPTFSDKTDYASIIQKCTGKGGLIVQSVVNYMNNRLAPGMQGFFMNHAATGDPNAPGASQWAQATTGACKAKAQGTCVKGVMEARYLAPLPPFVYDTEDKQTASGTCDFWMDVAEQIVKIDGSEQSFLVQDPDRLRHEL